MFDLWQVEWDQFECAHSSAAPSPQPLHPLPQHDLQPLLVVEDRHADWEGGLLHQQLHRLLLLLLEGRGSEAGTCVRWRSKARRRRRGVEADGPHWIWGPCSHLPRLPGKNHHKNKSTINFFMRLKWKMKWSVWIVYIVGNHKGPGLNLFKHLSDVITAYM